MGSVLRKEGKGRGKRGEERRKRTTFPFVTLRRLNPLLGARVTSASLLARGDEWERKREREGKRTYTVGIIELLNSPAARTFTNEVCVCALGEEGGASCVLSVSYKMHVVGEVKGNEGRKKRREEERESGTLPEFCKPIKAISHNFDQKRERNQLRRASNISPPSCCVGVVVVDAGGSDEERFLVDKELVVVCEMR